MDKAAIRRSLMDTWSVDEIKGEMERRNFSRTEGISEQVCVYVCVLCVLVNT
jgi:hypothetical protein